MSVGWPLFGHSSAQSEFLAAHDSGRLHHAWLIEGPEGIGKARLAMRLAAFLLGARGPTPNIFDAQTDDPVWRACAAESHPDLRITRRQVTEKGKLAQDISVDQIREFTLFFTMKAALGGWRAGVIDAIDETNRNGANALLKTLEEPPARCVIFLVNHGRQPLLPTIRSRCRVLKLSPLPEDQCRLALEAAGAPADAVHLARGRPGRGIRLSSAPALAAADAARALLRSAPRIADRPMMAALTAAMADDAAFEAFSTELLESLAERAVHVPESAKAWLSMARLLGEAETLKMDRAQVAAKLVSALYGLAQPV